MVVVEHLSLNGEKVGFVNYCKKALNPSSYCVPKTTLTHILFNLYKKIKKLIKNFKNFASRVSICS